MSRRVSSFAGTITLFVAFLAVFASASPANIPHGELGVERRNNEVEGVPSQSDTTDTTGAFSATHTGKATYYDVGLGACGQTNKNSDYIVALSKDDFNNKATCGKKVKITNTQTKKSTTVTVEDLCPSCPKGSVDLSPAAFTATGASEAEGKFPITWDFV